jgi:hypothetical protein
MDLGGLRENVFRGMFYGGNEFSNVKWLVVVSTISAQPHVAGASGHWFVKKRQKNDTPATLAVSRCLLLTGPLCYDQIGSLYGDDKVIVEKKFRI